MVALSRRRILCGITRLISSQIGGVPLSLEQCAEKICSSVPLEFREAVQSSDRFLFRGEDVHLPRILDPAPDLLDASTYGEPEALSYFHFLEKLLLDEDIAARPSTGHIGTATLADASAWGSAVSIWPLGDSMSYVWPKKRRLFYPGSSEDNIEALGIDQGLPTALETGKEVLFWTSSTTFCRDKSSFLAVPNSFSDELRRLLAKKRYGL